MWGTTLASLVVLMIVGLLAGSLAARVVTLSRTGYGPWFNMGLGMIGALVGKAIFWVFHIDLGVGEIKISVEDLIAAFAGSLLCIAGWWIGRKIMQMRAGK
jgi:uncharacterized membrane protein YeaQ/YmgE (transglycosylase-associated protein family)